MILKKNQFLFIPWSNFDSLKYYLELEKVALDIFTDPDSESILNFFVILDSLNSRLFKDVSAFHERFCCINSV